MNDEMDLKTRKYTAIEMIMQLDEKAMEKLEETLGNILPDYISIDEYNRQMEESEASIDQGEYYTQEEVEKMSKKW